MSVKIIDWRITSCCNNTCGFCYAASDLKSVTSAQAEEVIRAIYKTNCDTVCITGGEPLLNADYAIEVMRKLQGLGITIFLSTNGTNYINNINSIEPLISKLSIPLDGFCEKTNQINGRSQDSFNVAKEILDLYKKKNHIFPIKVATVITKKNLNKSHFVGIYNLLKCYSIDLWKIYQFIPESRGIYNQKEYFVSDQEWNCFVGELQPLLDNDAVNRQFNVAFTSRKERNSAYFIVQPDATVIIPIDNQSSICSEVRIGNLLTDNIDYVLSKWQEKVNDINVIGNSEKRSIIRPIHKLHIDEIDRKLLNIFDKYPLLSDLELSKKIATTENDIKERIEKLYRIRAIKQVIPIVNVSHFGLDVYLVNLFFATKDRASYIADILCRNPNIAWVAECYDWDETTNLNAIFRIAIFAENNSKASTVLNELENIFGRTLTKYEIDIVPDKYVCNQRFMLKTITEYGIDASHISLDHQEINSLSIAEFNLLIMLRSVDRPTISNLAVQMKTSKNQIEKLLDELEKNLIINKYQAVFDSNILGYKCYLLFIKFSHITEKKSFEDYAKKRNEVSHINTLNNGRWDIDIEIKIEHPEQCFKLISDFEAEFQGKILSTKLIRLEKEHKFEFLIPSVLDAVKNNVRKSILRKVPEIIRTSSVR